MKKNILVIASTDLKNPMRGTPIRIVKCIEQIAKSSSVTVVARSIDEKPDMYECLDTPRGNMLQRFLFYKKIIHKKKIDYIFTPTSTDIKMVLLLKILCQVPISIDIHGVANEEEFYFGYIGYYKKVYKGLVFKLQLSFFDAVFVVSKKMREYYRLSDSRGHVLYGGVSIDDFPYCASCHDSDSATFEVAYMGNARPYQGLPLLLSSLVGVPIPGLKLRLIISGDLSEVKILLQTYSLESITTIHQDVPHKEVSSLLSSADVLVIPRPSLLMTEYSYPSKLPECIATGIPVVVTDVGPVSELFVSGEHCVITSNDDSTAFGLGITSVYKASKEERERMGMAGRKKVIDDLSWDILGETIRFVFK